MMEVPCADLLESWNSQILHISKISLLTSNHALERHTFQRDSVQCLPICFREACGPASGPSTCASSVRKYALKHLGTVMRNGPEMM